MDWTAAVDLYCERPGPGVWAEPVNAATNAAFLVAALVMAVRLRRQRLPRGRAPGWALGWVLVGLLAAIGIGSLLFHTFAQRWAGLADTLPILLFILTYLYAATRDFLGASPTRAALAVAGFFPYAAVTVPLFRLIPGIGSSAGYAPVPLLIALYALALGRRAAATARGLGLGAGLLTLSIAFRALDDPLCAVFPVGTHFLWHLTNALMLGWMIEVHRRHRGRATPAPRGAGLPGRAPGHSLAPTRR